MSFLNRSNRKIKITVLRGFSYGPRTFSKGVEVDGEFVVSANTSFEAQLEVSCVRQGVPVLVLSSEDSGSGLTIDGDDLIVTLDLSPSQTGDLDFDCCDFVLFLYQGDVDDPSDKKPFVSGEIVVK